MVSSAIRSAARGRPRAVGRASRVVSRVQEDTHLAFDNLHTAGSERTALFAVFDGHSGAEVSAFAAQHLVSCGALNRLAGGVTRAHGRSPWAWMG